MKKITIEEAKKKYGSSWGAVSLGYNTAVDEANKYIELLERTSDEIRNRVIPQKDKEIAELQEQVSWKTNCIMDLEKQMKMIIKERNEWKQKHFDFVKGWKLNNLKLEEATRDNPSQVEPLVKCSIRSTDCVNNDGNGYCKYDITDCDYAKVKEQPSSLTTEESRLKELEQKIERLWSAHTKREIIYMADKYELVKRIEKLEASCIMDNPICQFCGKYKTLQGNGMIHPLCECGSINKIK